MKKNPSISNKRPIRTGTTNHPSQPASDLIALGSKPKDGRNLGNDSANQFRGHPPAKKPKPSLESVTARMSPTIPDTTAPCIDCLPEDIVHKVLKRVDSNKEQVEGLLCGAIKNLRLNRVKPDLTLVLSILYLAKLQPEIFNTEYVIESLCGLLKRDVGVDYVKSKTNNIVAILACNILLKILENEKEWPSLIVQVFLDDSFADRIWVDHVECQSFVGNVLTAFGTKSSKKIENDHSDENIDCGEKLSLPRFNSKLKSVQSMAVDTIKDRLSRRQTDLAINSVSVGQNQAANNILMQVKYLIQTLTSACGIQEIRTVAVHKLDMWLQNPKFAKPAQDLLHSICVNCNTHSQEDVNVIGSLTKLRLKSKVHLSQYLLSIKELIDAHPDNLQTLLTCVLYNELSNARNQSNMAVVASALQHYPEAASKKLALVCQDLLLQQEDYSRHVRGLLREIVRAVKQELPFTSLALGLMQEPDMEKYLALDQAHKERYISSTCDLICLIMLLSLTPQAKEAVNVAIGKKKAADSFVSNPTAVYLKFKKTVSDIQHDALWWMHAIVMPRLAPALSSTPPTTSYYLQLIYKLLFMKQTDSYHIKDNWPPETERSFMVKACHDAPVREDALLRVAAIGLSQENPIAAGEALELLNQLVKRAAALASTDLNPIEASRVDFIDTMLTLCQYRHPPNIKLPSDYVPPSLAISHHYWTALFCLIVVISLNPRTTGHQAWTHYPMLKVLMEMLIVNRFTYPPVTLADDDVRNQMVGKELQLSLLEKSEILEFESHLAAATTGVVVTEESSLLLSQLMAMDPQGHPRRPPDRFLDALSNLSSRLQLGTWLCRSRQPDFLLEIINRHGENQSMPWLPDLVSSSKSDVGLLPVQCLCEFLIIHETESEKLQSGGIHVHELVSQLQKILMSQNMDEPLHVVQYFLKRLHSPQTSMRERSRKALSLILTNLPSEDMETDQSDACSFRWLIQDFVQLPHYATVIRPQMIEALQRAVMVETDPLCVTAYVRFLVNDLQQFENLSTPEESYAKSTHYARMVSHLLVDRRILVDAAFSLVDERLLSSDDTSAGEGFMISMLEIFIAHLQLARQHEHRRRATSSDAEKDAVPWSDSQDEFYVRWPNNMGAATLHILVPQASIILLGYGPPSFIGRRTIDEASYYQHDRLYDDFMNMWFSDKGYVIPQAFLMDTQEEAFLIPDWMRLKMMRSEVMPATRRMAFAAVRNLEVDQIVLFVQSFGIPVESMNLLLEILDSQCASNADVILSATSGNASYMTRLLQVQRMRGCKAGAMVEALLKESNEETVAKLPSTPAEEMRCEDSPDSPMEVEVLPRREKVVPQQAPQMKGLLLQLFTGANSSHSADWSNLLHSINQSNPSSVQTCVVCIQSLHSLLFTDSSLDFNSLYHCPSRVCCLLRSLNRIINPISSSHRDVFDLLKEIIEQIYERGKAIMDKLRLKSSPLLSFASLWRSRNASGNGLRRASSASEQSDNLRQSDWSKLEEFLKHQLAYLDKDKEIKSKIDLVAQILLEEISHRRTQMSLGKIHYNNVCFTSIGTTGLLVDWLQLLDPELLARTPVLQRKLLFASGRNDFSDVLTVEKYFFDCNSLSHVLPQEFTTPVFDQAYLLSLLAEHCNWTNIHSCLNWLLSDVTPDPTNQSNTSQNGIAVDPKTALDFVWVVMQAPKIWKGRENKSSSLNEPVLQLTTRQFSRLLSYVVAATANQNVTTPTLSSSHDTSYVDLFNFYFRKFGQHSRNREDICDVVLFLKSKIDSSSPYSPYADTWWQLLAQLYIIQPHLPVWDCMLVGDESGQGFNQSDLEKFSDVVTSVDVGCSCYTDAHVSSLLNRLGYVRSKSTIETRMMSSVVLATHNSACDANLTLAKMAQSRPLLVLRQLPLLSSMLRGRTRLDFFEFKVQHHLPLMTNTIGILRQLAPFLFRQPHKDYLYTIIESFWQMLKNYCHRARRQMLSVLMKTLALTQEYLRNSPANATKLLSEYPSTFQVLLKTYWDHESVVASVSALQSSVFCWSNNADSSGPLANSARPSALPLPDPNNEKVIPLYLEMLDEDQDLENTMQVLADFDESSKRRVDNIAPYLSRLCRIFSRTRDPSARVTAFAAAIQHAHSFPDCAGREILPMYINCLRGMNQVSNHPRSITRGRSSDGLTFAPTSTDPLSRTLLGDSSTSARDLLQFLPEMSILCLERALELLGAAFDAGLKSGAAFSYPKLAAADCTTNRSWETADVTAILSRSLWLLRGLDESDANLKS